MTSRHTLERDTKMTYQNVSIVLSPTMQISHRVLNVFLLNRAYLFGGVAIKKFWAPSCTRELTVLASGQVAKMRQCQCLECHCAWPSSAARHTMASSCPPLSGSALTR
ncbi:uncharacterized protein LOC126992822 [Eriocheir sinensis]|uniref:uncharacterized protein LOC126992822 n=1 Tax=Eriocheir sinensis TaxID=95602 RepID=UPI0021C93A6E|nr:uncharacterized protein LOC126992822 [Eriocheir sinensis]